WRSATCPAGGPVIRRTHPARWRAPSSARGAPSCGATTARRGSTPRSTATTPAWASWSDSSHLGGVPEGPQRRDETVVVDGDHVDGVEAEPAVAVPRRHREHEHSLAAAHDPVAHVELVTL